MTASAPCLLAVIVLPMSIKEPGKGAFTVGVRGSLAYRPNFTLLSESLVLVDAILVASLAILLLVAPLATALIPPLIRLGPTVPDK